MLQTNEKRREALRLPFNPLTGEGAPGKRFRLELDDYELPVQYLPEAMKEDAAIQELMQLRNVKAYVVRRGMHLHKFIDRFRRLRFRHDFYYWAHCNVMIKPKGEGSDVPFCPNMPQRRLIETFEAMRREEKPIRVILLKARQWGGSTATQIYMAWLQLIHRRGMNSLIVGHQKDAAAEVCGMFEKLIDAYPDELLYDPGSKPRHKEKKMLANALTRNIRTIPQRGCKIKVGSAKMPDSARGGDATLVHCTEVAFWEKTEGKSPEQIVRSACSGTLPRPMTMIVYESTANGVGNFFQREYEAAKRGTSIFLPVFVAWWQIETYQLDFASDAEPSAAPLPNGSVQIARANRLTRHAKNRHATSGTSGKRVPHSKPSTGIAHSAAPMPTMATWLLNTPPTTWRRSCTAGHVCSTTTRCSSCVRRAARHACAVR